MSEKHLRLIWPQWQGAGSTVVSALMPEFPLPMARRGYVVGSTVLAAVLPPHDGPTVTVPTELSDVGTAEQDGIEAKDAVVSQLVTALDIIAEYSPERILTLGGECSTSIAPFSALAKRYGEDLAVIWIDAHPDVDTPETHYPGHHAMAVSVLTGHGDPDIQTLLPAVIAPHKIAIAGLHAWTEDAYPNLEQWGITAFSPADLRENSKALMGWLASTGCTKVAIHLDVDVVDSNEIVFGLGMEPDGMSIAEVRKLVNEINSAADVVGLTIAEFIPRQVMRLQEMVREFPLV